LDTIVLHQRISVPFGWRLDVQFPLKEDIDPAGFLAQPYVDGEPLWGLRVGVNYFGRYTLGWTRELDVDDWVAFSFERFAPDRTSVEYIAQVTDGYLFQAPSPPP
jgi:hypothetical protein